MRALSFLQMEKQALLEIPDLQTRWESLITLMEMAIVDSTIQGTIEQHLN